MSFNDSLPVLIPVATALIGVLGTYFATRRSTEASVEEAKAKEWQSIIDANTKFREELYKRIEELSTKLDAAGKEIAELRMQIYQMEHSSCYRSSCPTRVNNPPP